MLKELPQLLRAMRPHQWTKNALVLAAIIFAMKWHDMSAVRATVQAFAAFCALSSFTYLLNDLRDAEEDRHHPTKRNRPIASGRLRPSTAWAAGFVLLAAGMALAFDVNAETGLIASTYMFITVLYQLGMKNMVILDVLALSAGFVLRAVAGATAIQAEISPWLLICTMQLSLFLALGKRRGEIVLLGDGAAAHRAALAQYSTYLLDQMISVVTASTVMSYALYTISDRTVKLVGSTHMMYTLPFVIYGIFRYLYIIHNTGMSDAPDKALFADKPLLSSVVLFVATACVILWLGHR